MESIHSLSFHVVWNQWRDKKEWFCHPSPFSNLIVLHLGIIIKRKSGSKIAPYSLCRSDYIIMNKVSFGTSTERRKRAHQASPCHVSGHIILKKKKKVPLLCLLIKGPLVKLVPLHFRTHQIVSSLYHSPINSDISTQGLLPDWGEHDYAIILHSAIHPLPEKDNRVLYIHLPST